MLPVLDTVADDVLYPERQWLTPYLRPSLPPAWKRFLNENADSVGWEGKGLRVMLSGRQELDNRRWIHLSCSRKDLCLVKKLFLGKDTRALQLFVPEAEHFNFHRYCLHLWHCIDDDGLPDFRDSHGRV